MNEKNNSKFKKIVRTIIIILSVLIFIVAAFFSIYCFVNAFTMDSIEFFGPLANIFVFVGGFVSMIYGGILISILWIIYGIIILIYNIYNKLSYENSRRFVVVLVTLLLLVFSGLVISDIYNDRNKQLDEVLLEPPSYEFYDDSSYYFIYNDKIYYYELSTSLFSNKISDKFYVMNLDGSNNKLLAEGDELRYLYFYFVHDGDAYYYSTYYNENMKINLDTGKITRLDNNDNYIPKTYDNGVVTAFYDNAVVGNEYTSFKKINLNTNQVIFDTVTSNSLGSDTYFLDYDSGNIYYLEDHYVEYPTIYKNKDVLYEFKDTKDINIKFLAVDNNYLYYIFGNTIYKLDVNSGVSETLSFCTYKLDEIKRISSGNNMDNYFYINGIIYEFDLNDASFKVLIRNVDVAPEFVYNFEDKLIFTENTDNCKYLSDINNTGTIIIYDIFSRYAKHIDNIRKASFDSNYLYVLVENDDRYYVDKYDLD